MLSSTLMSPTTLRIPSIPLHRTTRAPPPRRLPITGSGLVIECSSRPQKKATAHHMKTRPKKSQPWDIKRKPTVYPPLPPLPPDWTLVERAHEDDENEDAVEDVVEAAVEAAAV
ncbi:Large ribosomal subunit protein cL38-like protein [Drosera capensis]